MWAGQAEGAIPAPTLPQAPEPQSQGLPGKLRGHSESPALRLWAPGIPSHWRCGPFRVTGIRVVCALPSRAAEFQSDTRQSFRGPAAIRVAGGPQWSSADPQPASLQPAAMPPLPHGKIIHPLRVFRVAYPGSTPRWRCCALHPRPSASPGLRRGHKGSCGPAPTRLVTATA